MAQIAISNPEALGKPLGPYSQIARVRASEFVFIAGQVATDKAGNLVGSDDFEAQCAQVFANIAAALGSAGAGWSSVVQFTTYLVHSQDIGKFMALSRPRVPPDVRKRRLPAEHPADRRPAGAGEAADRGPGDRRALACRATAAIPARRG